ncbi:MAG: hypothetical protein J5I92_09935 [Thiogranum sp.]|nr:hypothetical protein [Thiogranum sp.]
MAVVLAKGIGIWLVILMVAAANGLFRETVLAPLLGARLALPVSGVLLCVLVLLMAWLLVPWLGRLPARWYAGIGIVWMTLTLVFELVLGRYLAGQAWRDILQVFDVSNGDLFVAVLVMSGVAPWLAARMRGLH